MRDDFYGFSLFLETTFQSSWKITQTICSILKCICLFFFQNTLELFQYGISPLIYAASLPVFRDRSRIPPLAEWNGGYRGYAVQIQGRQHWKIAMYCDCRVTSTGTN